MATTRTIRSAATSNGYVLELRTAETVDVDANASAIAWSLVLISGDYRFETYRVGWSVSADGAVLSSRPRASAPQVSIPRHGELTVASGTAAIAHGDDGTKTVAWQAAIDMESAGYPPGSMSLSGDLTLTPIPRASVLDVSDGTLGVEQELTLHRAASAFTHTLTYVCGEASGTIGTSEFTGSGSVLRRRWTPRIALAAQNTTGTSVAVTLTLTTKNGSVTVGSRTYAVTMAIPASVKPEASATVALVNDNATVSGWGVAVKGYSKYRITAAFTSAQGSTAKAWEIVANGQTLTAAVSTTGVLTTTSRKVRVRVRDSRGRWSDPVTVTGPRIWDYAAPTVSAATAARCLSNGTADEEGTYLRLRCAGNVSSCDGHNQATVQARLRRGGGSWGSWTTLTNGVGQTVNAALSAAESGEVQFRVTDSLGRSKSVTVTVPTASVTLNLRAGGRGAAFGRYATADGKLQVAWDLELDAPLGVSSGGTGQSVRRASVTVTPDAATASDHAVTVRHFPYLGGCFVRGYVKFDHVAVAAGTWVTVATVPEGYRPAATTALSVSVYGGGSALVTAAGELRVRPLAALSGTGNYDVYFSGWWETA